MNTNGCAGLCTEQGMAAAHAAYHTRLLARARRIVVDPDLAEDVVQEAFLRAWRACASFDPEGGPLVNWLLVETPNWSRQEIDAVVKSGERKDAKVARPVPLYWVYVTAWATPDGVTQFREDIYNRDGLGPVAATTKRG